MDHPASPSLALRDLARIVLFAALIAALGLLPPIPVPIIPVPITAQTLGVMLAGAVLGPKRGALAAGLFLLVTAMGFPLLAGGRGGLAVFAGPSAGFLLGWPLGAAVTGWLAARATSIVRLGLACGAGGIGAVYLIGVPWMAQVADLTLGQAMMASLAFVPGDLVKVVAAALATQAIRRGYPALTAR
ncbi:MAG: biotin transporter BioY [Rhodospirillaceae bacterium]|nr:biotin transporter BioY [Rhodospirillaceae bacterium]